MPFFFMQMKLLTIGRLSQMSSADAAFINTKFSGRVLTGRNERGQKFLILKEFTISASPTNVGRALPILKNPLAATKSSTRELILNF